MEKITSSLADNAKDVLTELLKKFGIDEGRLLEADSSEERQKLCDNIRNRVCKEYDNMKELCKKYCDISIQNSNLHDKVRGKYNVLENRIEEIAKECPSKELQQKLYALLLPDELKEGPHHA